MKKIVFYFIGIVYLILLTHPVNGVSDSELFMSVIVEYSQGKISFQEPNLIQSTEAINKEEKIGNYTLRVYSFKNEILYETKINFDLAIFGAPLKEWFDKEGNQVIIPNETDTSIIDKASQVVFIPYFKTGKSIIMYDLTNTVVANIDISKFAVCNQNEICDTKETEELCPNDCSSTSSTYKPISFWQWVKNLLSSIFR